MKYDFRLLRTGFHDAAFNMGFDEAILESVAAGVQKPTLRLYAWKPAAVSIGFFQGLRDEVDTDSCAAHGVDVVRRITGGGAVFHQAEITYSIVIPETSPLAPKSILDSYGILCGGVIEGLRGLGLESSFAPINDIVSGGKKVSGNAQTRKKNCLLQHGTVLLDVDVELMFDLLKVPAEKAKGKLIQDVKERVTGVNALLGRTVDYSEAEAAMASGFSKALDAFLTESGPSAVELDRAGEIARTKFADPSWTGRR
ncbi:MAG: biotin/lipoate A/B protein ligase family protein [Treponemataceae bacterium]